MQNHFVVIPQWQGSGSSRAMQLADGAEAIRGDLPTASTILVPVPLGAGSSQGSGVQRLTALQRVREQTLESIAKIDGTIITIGGDCGVALAPIEHALTNAPRGVAVVWLDAHPGLNTEETSPSGAFSGMVLRTLLGDGPAALTPHEPLDASQLILAGTRVLDEAEEEFIETARIRMLSADELTPAALSTCLGDTNATSVYLHIDLDVLDPAEFSCLASPAPFGISVAKLIENIRAARSVLPLVGATITSFAPGSQQHAEHDLPTILRIIAALTAKPAADLSIKE